MRENPFPDGGPPRGPSRASSAGRVGNPRSRSGRCVGVGSQAPALERTSDDDPGADRPAAAGAAGRLQPASSPCSPASFDYPDILRQPTGQVLARFAAGGSRLVLIWWGFAMSAVLLAPAVVLVSATLADADPTVLALATAHRAAGRPGPVPGPGPLALRSSRYLARLPVTRATTSATRDAVEVVFQTLNRYLGVAVGEHLGYLFTGLWTALAGDRPHPVRRVAPAVRDRRAAAGAAVCARVAGVRRTLRVQRLEAGRHPGPARLHRLVGLAAGPRHRPAASPPDPGFAPEALTHRSSMRRAPPARTPDGSRSRRRRRTRPSRSEQAPRTGPAPSRPHPGKDFSSASRSSWRTCPKVKARRNVPSVEGAMTRWPSTLAVCPQRSRSASSMQAPRQQRVDQGQQLAAGPVRAGPLAQIDHRIGGLLDPQPLGQGGRQQQARVGDGVGVVQAGIELVQGVGGSHREHALLAGNTAAVAGAMLPGQRAFLSIGTSSIR